MYHVNDRIHYGGSGVCTVQDITTMRFGRTREKDYVLKPLHQNASVIYVPVNNEQLVGKMRPVMTRDEVEQLIRDMPEIETVWVDDIQARKATFDQLLRGNNCTDLIKIIKTLYQHKKRRQAMGKTLHVSDENYLREAQRLLYDEIAGVMGMNPNEVNAYILERVDLSA